MTHSELVIRACRWLAVTKGMHVVIPELSCWATKESPDVIGYMTQLGGAPVHTVVVECKMSRSDFFADRSKPFRVNSALGMGRVRWMFTPKALVKEHECPLGWGLAEVMGLRVRVVRRPEFFERRDMNGEMGLLVAAMRRVVHPSLKFPPVHFVVPEKCRVPT